MPVPLSPEAVQRVIDIGNATREQYPRAWSKCHHEDDPERLDFIILFGRACVGDDIISQTHLSGLNGKRGDPNTPSMDILNFKHLDTADDRDVTSADVVLGAGGTNPSIQYDDITDPAGAGAIYIDPFDWQTIYDYSTVQPPTPTHNCLLGTPCSTALAARKRTQDGSMSSSDNTKTTARIACV